jgi:hypothetical protein
MPSSSISSSTVANFEVAVQSPSDIRRRECEIRLCHRHHLELTAVRRRLGEKFKSQLTNSVEYEQSLAPSTLKMHRRSFQT